MQTVRENRGDALFMFGDVCEERNRAVGNGRDRTPSHPTLCGQLFIDIQNHFSYAPTSKGMPYLKKRKTPKVQG